MAVEGDDLRLFPLGGGESRPVTGAKPGDEPLRWSANPNLVFVARRAGAVMQVESIDITRGTRTPMMEVSVRDRVGASGVQRLVLSADGKSYAYLYTRTLQNLYVVKNVK
jgi:hypothetical protein